MYVTNGRPPTLYQVGVVLGGGGTQSGKGYQLQPNRLGACDFNEMAWVKKGWPSAVSPVYYPLSRRLVERTTQSVKGYQLWSGHLGAVALMSRHS